MGRLDLLTKYAGQAWALLGRVLSLSELGHLINRPLCYCLPCRDVWLIQGPPSPKLSEFHSPLSPVSPRAAKPPPGHPHSVTRNSASSLHPCSFPKGLQGTLVEASIVFQTVYKSDYFPI